LHRPIRLIACFILPLAAAACLGQDEPAKQKDVITGAGDTASEYVSADGAYRITCPEGWTKLDTGVRAFDAAFFCVADRGVNFTVARAPAGNDREITEAAAREMRDMFRQAYEGYTVTAEERREVDGVRAYILSARYKQMGMELQNRQVMFVKGATFYTLTYTSTPPLFMKHLGDFERAAGSFRAAGNLEGEHEKRKAGG
jgi:hypothetical protein